MFTYNDLHSLLYAQPFVPFRLVLSDGGFVDVRHREMVTAGRRYAVIGIPDPKQPDAPFDKHAVVWYMHVTRAELLDSGRPPMAPPGPESTSPAHS